MNYSKKLKRDLYEVLASLMDIDVEIFSFIIKILIKEKVSDSLEFFAKYQNQKHLEQYIFQVHNLEMFDKWWKQDAIKNNIRIIINVLKEINEHDFNKNDYSTEIFIQIRKSLINKIKDQQMIINFLKFLVQLTAIDKQFIQCGSNSLNLLVQMKIDLTNQSFERIRIENTSLIGGNFVRCNLNESEFNNVDISGMNINGALLFNCKWKNIKIHELNQLVGHKNRIETVCFSPDGTTLASGSYDKSICLWDVKTGLQKAKLNGHRSQVRSVCFSPDGTSLASGSFDESIILWEVKTRKRKSKLDCHKYPVISICFSPDGTTLASGSFDQSIRLWDVKTGQQKANLDGHSNSVFSVSFSPDGTTLASGSGDQSILLWDVKTGQQKANLDGHSNYVYSVCFSPDGTTLASGSRDNSIRLWDVKTGQQKGKFDGHTNSVISVCFSPDGTTLATGSADNSIRLWDVKTGQQKAKFDGHKKKVCFSPDGTTLASGSEDQSIRLWDVKTGQQKAKLDSHTSYVQSVCFSPDGTTLASGSGDSSIRLWDVTIRQQFKRLDKKYKDLYVQFKIPLNQNNHLPESTQNINILLISQSAILQSQGTLIFNGEFVNHQGRDLRSTLKSKGSFFLETNLEKYLKLN
ncbi:unnamed protein product [Paramecium sonneborni]|uniref:EML-like second beta-propeller domain-containing protein n=1 Tax=Paramecium sonneborni TaxID=65129 RepID=A0A8S1RM62_9CILI|nr:unnamed protein product [Paramecium sonneborni]